MRRAPRVGRNRGSGEPVDIPEKGVPHFKAGNALCATVDQRTEEMAKKRA